MNTIIKIIMVMLIAETCSGGDRLISLLHMVVSGFAFELAGRIGFTRVEGAEA